MSPKDLVILLSFLQVSCEQVKCVFVLGVQTRTSLGCVCALIIFSTIEQILYFFTLRFILLL